MGRHSEYTPEIGARVCELIAEGNTLVDTAEQVGFRTITINEWLMRDKDFASAYHEAREKQADVRADQIVSIADDESLSPESRKVRIDARKWVASKLQPKRYGDRTILAGDKDNPLVMVGLRLDQAIARRKMIDVTPEPLAIEDNLDLL